MELFRALAVLAEPPTNETVRLAEALDLGEVPSPHDYTQLFVFELYPYASVYLGTEGMLGGEARDRISGFWRVLGQTPPTESDHLSVMLAFYATLIDLEDDHAEHRNREVWRNTRKAFLWEHILSWLPVYLAKVADLAPAFYQRWSDVLMRALLEEASVVGPQETISIHLREHPGLIDPRQNAVDDFLQSVLAPIRSGMILTRSDLIRASRALDLSTRIGERKFILQTLFGQNPLAMLEWLSAEARSWATRHTTAESEFALIASDWEARAMESSRLIEELRNNTEEL